MEALNKPESPAAFGSLGAESPMEYVFLQFLSSSYFLVQWVDIIQSIINPFVM